MIKMKEKFLHWLEFEKGRSENTILAYKFELERFINYLKSQRINSLEKIEKNHIRNFLIYLSKTNEKQGRARALSCIKSFLKYLVRENFLESNPSFGIDTPKINHKVPSYFTETEYLHLLNTIREYAPPKCLKRDLAIVSLFLGTGIRRSELVNLDFNDVDLKEGKVKVTRKGGDQQLVEMGPDVVKALKEYLEERGNKTGSFFISNRGKRINKATVYYLVKKYLYFADLKGSPHSLRHTCFTELARKGVPFPVIQAIAGHKRAETTSRYTHTQEADRRKAVELIKLT
ncbi:MAG: tyrosine-type recombinase/integrase [Candidatus Aerophobetes bacterium]|nr:tyrosine-type recombinase/integrase [Candidatus Aerophobetes bacterium]